MVRWNAWIVFVSLLLVIGSTGLAFGASQTSAESEPSAPAACSESTAGENTDISSLVDAYNQNLGQQPTFVAGQLSGEVVDVRINATNGAVDRYTLVTDDEGRVVRYQCQTTPDNATVRMATNEQTIEGIRNAENHTKAATSAYRRGAITIRGVTLENKVLVKAGKVGMALERAAGGV
jgi:phosphatidate phosphatase APP1